MENISADAVAPRNGPLFAVNYLDFSGYRQVFAISIYFLVAETTSMQIILQDMDKLPEGHIEMTSEANIFQAIVEESGFDVGNETPVTNTHSCSTKEGNISTTDASPVQNSITLPPAITAALLDSSNSALSPQPSDVLLTIPIKSWSFVIRALTIRGS